MMNSSISSNNPASPVISNTDVQNVVTHPVVEVNHAAPDAAAISNNDPVIVNDPASVEPDAVVADPVVEPNKANADWAQRRINELTAKRYEEQRGKEAEKARADAAEAKTTELLRQIAEKSGNSAPTPLPAKASLSDADINKLVEEKAAQMAAAHQFNQACDEIANTGKKEFQDWNDVLKNLRMVGAIGEGTNPEFLQTAVELKSPHKILHYLGTNLEKAEEIVALPPKKMALEMARLEASLNAPVSPAAVSKAPQPVIPVAGNAAKAGNTDIADANIPMEEFLRLRHEQNQTYKNRWRK